MWVMLTIRMLSVLVVAVMVLTISFGLASGEFFSDGSAIWALPWGKVTLVDLYAGLILFGLWIALRETRRQTVAFWWVGLALLGNLVAALYVAKAAFGSETVEEMLIGKRRAQP